MTTSPFENPDFVKEVFTYQKPTPEQVLQYEAIRAKAMELVTIIVQNSPRSADQSTAIRRVREAVMNANAAIALGGIV